MSIFTRFEYSLQYFILSKCYKSAGDKYAYNAICMILQ